MPADEARAADVYEMRLPTKVTSVRQTVNGSFAVFGEEAFRLDPCPTPEGLCLSSAPFSETSVNAPRNALPGGQIDIADAGDIRNAWYGRPTERYAHGALGDDVEGGSLIVVTSQGKKLEFVLPETQVFEDITPRITDLDGDGNNEVVTIRSSQSGGAAVVIYGLEENELVERAAGSENGAPNRWLNIAGIIRSADGTATVYGVRTPHIGGRLFSITYQDGALNEVNNIATDFSNHVLGSTELGLSAVMDFDGDGIAELVLPSQDRTRLRFPLSDRLDIALPAPVDKAIIATEGRIVTATEDGALLIIVP
ncbi:hypothetical protein [Oricola cellulosilytica]|uniref:hypothetical protein n=1 Tax=Oricola cellulosilytica TaxID=1429082 RepID=UPI001CC0A631|nr:hypothetical protein [Oricola cellulosilytica]